LKLVKTPKRHPFSHHTSLRLLEIHKSIPASPRPVWRENCSPLVIQPIIKQGLIKSDKVIALLKELARKIRKEDDGIDATIIIISSKLPIPQELEKLTTVLELELPDEAEISCMIDRFAEDNEISSGPAEFRAELATALKGLSESEIKDLLSLAVSQDGELTRKALQLIFDQKQQMIL